MVVVAQLVRASDCDSEGRGFETHHPPKRFPLRVGFFIGYGYNKWHDYHVFSLYKTFVNSTRYF